MTTPTHGGSDARGQAAEQWARWAPLLAQTPAVRISPDGGASFPKWKAGRRYERALTELLPTAPATVYLADPATRMSTVLALDFDVSVLADPGEVARQADDFVRVVHAAGGICVVTVSPSGGRHVWGRWAVPLPFEELRDLAAAAARRYPSVDTSPNSSVFGQLRPPGAPHKLAPGAGRLSGYVLLDMDPVDEQEALHHPCGPQVWARLQEAFAGELQHVAPAADPGPAPLDTAGQPWRPRVGGRRPLPARYAALAQTGAHRAAGYRSPSEARFAVLLSAAHAGWRLADVRGALDAGDMPGLARLLAHKSEWHLEHDWKKAVDAAGRDAARKIHTRESDSTPPGTYPHLYTRDDDQPLTEYQQIRRWVNAIRLAERDPTWRALRGRQAISARMVLRALGQAAQRAGSTTAKVGVRSLAEATGLDHSTVAAVLRNLRADPDPLVILEREGEGEHPDEYSLRLPDAYAETAAWMRWRAGQVTAAHPAFWPGALGHAAALVYEALSTAETTAADLQRLAVLGRTATAAALRDLAAHGLAVHGPHGWRRGPISPDTVATELGAWALQAQKRDRHRAERRTWRALLADARARIRAGLAWIDRAAALIPAHLVAPDPSPATALAAGGGSGPILRAPP